MGYRIRISCNNEIANDRKKKKIFDEIYNKYDKEYYDFDELMSEARKMNGGMP